MGAGAQLGASLAAAGLVAGLGLRAGAEVAPARGNVERAHALAERSITEYDLGDFAAALQDATEAYRLDRRPALLFNLGQCNRALGNWAKAEFFYRGYLRYVPRGAHRATVEKLIADMQAKARRVAPPLPRTALESAPQEAPPAAPPSRPVPAAASSPPRAFAEPPPLVPPAPAPVSPPTSPLVAAAPPASVAEASPGPSRSHALGWTLLTAGVAAGGVAIGGAVRVAGFEGTLGQLSPTSTAQAYLANIGPAYRGQANAVNWEIASIVLGAVALAAIAGGIVAW